MQFAKKKISYSCKFLSTYIMEELNEIKPLKYLFYIYLLQNQSTINKYLA